MNSISIFSASSNALLCSATLLSASATFTQTKESPDHARVSEQVTPRTILELMSFKWEAAEMRREVAFSESEDPVTCNMPPRTTPYYVRACNNNICYKRKKNYQQKQHHHHHATTCNKATTCNNTTTTTTTTVQKLHHAISSPYSATPSNSIQHQHTAPCNTLQHH